MTAAARWRALLAGGATACVTAGMIVGPQPLDDAFITLRYARSLASGGGFTFNPGERVLGTTTPLFALVLALAHRLTGIDLIWLAFTLALAAHVAAAVLLAVCAKRCGYPGVGLVAAGLYVCAPLALHATIGCMETSLFVLATLCALAPGARSAVLAGTAAAAAALVRPEGVLTVALCLARAARRGPRAALTVCACVAAAVVPWVAFAIWYFGSPLPQSVIAKSHVYALVPAELTFENFWYLLVGLPIAGPKIALSGLTAAPFGTLIAQAIQLPVPLEIRRIGVLISGVAVLVTVGIGAACLRRGAAEISWLLVFAAGYIASYCVARPKMFPWYLVPPLPVLLLAFLTGAATVLRSVAGRCRGPIAGSIAVLMIGGALWQSARTIRSFPPTPRIRAYRTAMQMLEPFVQDPATLIGAFEIGAIGYYSRARILDHFGLVSPDVLQLGVAGAIERYRPDFYVGYQMAFGLGGFYGTPAFVRDYELIGRLAAFTPDGTPLLLYRRRPAPP